MFEITKINTVNDKKKQVIKKASFNMMSESNTL